ncbi:hypothetical protein [Lewinella sp. 4G2]|uniref:hypothetical protein n=1 Tax=Lewinella sp. 4G2 TaxID=1803372 RepID=UPI0012FA608A|nr:hypothetical protein [Lewinella sp. 4G2]
MKNQQTQYEEPKATPPVVDPSSDKPPERERIRDLLVVFVFYPISPTKRIEEVAERRPWLEFLALLLKAALAAYAIYEGAGGDWAS